MNNKKKIAILVITICVICVSGFGILYKIKANDKKDIASHYFPQKSQEYIRDMMIYNGEVYEDDKLIYTLENSVYVQKCDMGYYVMSIKQKDGEIDILNNIIENRGIKFLGSFDTEFELENNILYCYCARTCDGFEKDQILVEGIVEHEFVEFYLKDSGGAKVYINDGIEADISPIGIRVVKASNVEIKEVTLNYSSNKKITIYKKDTDNDEYIMKHMMNGSCGTMGKSWDMEDGQDAFNALFDEWMDISDLESISVNGEKLELEIVE
jgi:hypothetical protein